MPEAIQQQVTSYLPTSSYYYVIPSSFANTFPNYNKPKCPKVLRINQKIKDLNFAFNEYEIRWISGIRKYFFLLYRISSKLKANFPTYLHKIYLTFVILEFFISFFDFIFTFVEYIRCPLFLELTPTIFNVFSNENMLFIPKKWG